MKSPFVDRELSWLKFNARVLSEAESPDVPLLERLKFLNIFYSNLDEFFMVRVGSLTHRSIIIPDSKDPKTGWTPEAQLKNIFKEVSALQKRASLAYDDLMLDLKSSGIEIVDFNNISKLDASIAKKLYAEVKDYLFPRIIDEKKPMVFLSNRELYVATNLVKGDAHYLGICSLYRVPPFRVFETNGAKKVFVMSELVSHYAKNLFKKYTVKESCVIKIIRNADIFIESKAIAYLKDFKGEFEKLLKKRKRQQPVYIQIDGKPSKGLRQMILRQLGLEERRAFVSRTPLDLDFAKELGSLPQFKYVPRKTVRGVKPARGQLIKYIQGNDLLLSFPYHSMDAFVDLLYEAADNPTVQSIKITLYRLSYSSKVAMALAYAADKGKEVVALLELRARFDEKNNIDYSEMMTAAGCKVIYGLPEMKVHAKLCLITRKVGRGYSYITQIGTGNYNENTSSQYCDLSLITADKAVAADAEKVFDALVAAKAPARCNELMVAPYGYKQRLIELLEGECEKGSAGAVCIKVNSLNDMDVMHELIKCSKAGVSVELFIRGICCLVPGIKGVSENITVKSVVGRYLEHSRIIVVGKGKAQRMFIGSGDLMNRNTNRRVEVLAEVHSPDIKKQILYLMNAFRDDCENGWIMQDSGAYKKCAPVPGTSSFEKLYKYFTK